MRSKHNIWKIQRKRLKSDKALCMLCGLRLVSYRHLGFDSMLNVRHQNHHCLCVKVICFHLYMKLLISMRCWLSRNEDLEMVYQRLKVGNIHKYLYPGVYIAPYNLKFFPIPIFLILIFHPWIVNAPSPHFPTWYSTQYTKYKREVDIDMTFSF